MTTINKKQKKVNSIVDLLRANGVSEDQIKAISPGLEETVEDSVTSADLKALQEALLGEIKTVAAQAVEFKRANDRADDEAKKNIAARQELKKQLDERNKADDEVAKLAQVVSSLSEKQSEASKALDSINKEISAEDGQIANLSQNIGNLETKVGAQEQVLKAALVEIKTQLKGLPQGIATLVENQISSIIETKITEVLEKKLGVYVESLTKIESDLRVVGGGFKKLMEKMEVSVDAAIGKMEKGSEEVSKRVKSVSDEAGKARDKLVETRTSFDDAFADLSNLVSSLKKDINNIQKEKRELITIANRTAQGTNDLMAVQVSELITDFMNKYEVLNNNLAAVHRQRMSESTNRENQVYKDVKAVVGGAQEVFDKMSTLVAGIDVARIESLKDELSGLTSSQQMTVTQSSAIHSELKLIKEQMKNVDAIADLLLEKNEKDMKGGNQ